MYFAQTLLESWFHGFHVFMIRFLIIFFLASAVSSTYNPSHRHFVENFDPNEANPKKNLSCVGDSYDLRLPLLNGFNPNGLSMQKLCAKPQYGGGAQHQHAGAYCYYPLEPRNPKFADDIPPYDSGSSIDWESSNDSDSELPEALQWMLRGKIVFDNNPGATPNRQLQNPRMLQACLYRCFCNYGVEDVSVQPPTDHMSVRTWPSIDGYQLQIDVNDDFTVPYEKKKGQADLRNVDSTPIYKKPQIDRMGLGWVARPIFMNLHPDNEIECSGDLPKFALPSPYSRDEFSSVQELCAVALSGGNKDVNAGGYCHRSTGGSSISPEVEDTVWFSDSMTPRLDWTWGGGNFLATANIRFHCWRHCWCRYEPPKNPDSTKIWRFLTGLGIGVQNDGSVVLKPAAQQSLHSQQQEGEAQGHDTSTYLGSTQQQILPPQPPGVQNSPSGTCGPGHNEFCPKQWDTAAWGPIPREPPNVTDIVTPSPPKPGVIGICGNKCSGPQDCGTTDGNYTCSCAFPSDSDARLLGLDPVAPVAVCIALLATAVGGSGKGWLGGRDVELIDGD